ncbi:MAG TPA: carbonic anhydrase [Anaerolineales bacterium]|jgi:carbonic anhydrase|nr:carbonic anhydrase [Anaerolineales bacterium]
MAKKPVLQCDALVVHCMDYRLQKYLHPWIMSRFGADNFDIISLAGGVHDYEMVLKYVQLAVQVHSIKQVVLINHEDCRAYGRDGTYKRHKHDLMDAEQKIEVLFSDLEVETFYLHLNGTFELISRTQ